MFTLKILQHNAWYIWSCLQKCFWFIFGHWHRSSVFILNLEQISNLILVVQLLTLNRWFLAGTDVQDITNTSTDSNGHSHICVQCGRRFRTKRGLNQHLRSCYLKNKITDVQTPYERNEDDAKDQTSDDSNTEIADISNPPL